MLALFGALPLLVPVLLLPVSTAVPAANWISLLIADLVVIGWLVARRDTGASGRWPWVGWRSSPWPR